ncbi:MAG: PAS domain S-box protein [FCB group bacterium]|jgi:PAS domain S-box-containing protein|nr:PAS domain S-box protein [FCB group bacterium]
MQRFSTTKAIAFQLGAVILAIALNFAADYLESRQIIIDTTSRLMTLISILALLAQPSYVMLRVTKNNAIRFSFFLGGFLMCFYHILRIGERHIFTELSGPALDALHLLNSTCTFAGVGFILSSLYLAVLNSANSEASLRVEEERFRKLVETAHEAIAILDSKLYFVFVNPRFAETLGVSAQSIVGRHLHDILSPQNLPEELRERTLASANFSVRFESGLRLPSGVTLHMLGSAAGLGDPREAYHGTFIMLTDITALKQAETALRDSEQNYREIFDAANEGLIIFDLDGRILDINKRTSELFGIEREDALNLSINDFNNVSPARPHEEAVEWLRKSLHEETQLVEWNVRSRQGRVFWTEVALRASNIGGRRCVIAAVRDISERKQLEAQLQQAQKMEAVGQLAGGVAHDFNNLLQVINGHSDFALEESSYDARTREALLEIQRAGQSATQLVRQLLAFSRQQVLNKEILDLNEVIGSTITLLHRVIGEHIQIAYVPGRKLETILADRGQMEQVLMNLCVNARDAMPTGGTMTIETGMTNFDRDFCQAHSWAKEGQFVQVTVSDTGGGMDPQTLARIWEPFFTTKEVGRGTGLGLATVYGIVRQHDGMVHVYSEPDKGTVFKIYLPAARKALRTPPASAKPALRGGSETILLAEDNEMVRNITKRILEQAGYQVITARDGLEALEIFEREGDTITLALMDMVMPGLGGYAVSEKVRERFPQARFLFASGYSADMVQTGLVNNEGFELIQKPFKRSDLLERVRKVIETG